MSARSIFILFLVIFVLDFLVDWMLIVLNMREAYRNRKTIPSRFAAVVTPHEYFSSVRYTLEKGRFALIHTLWGRLIMLLMLAGGLAGALQDLTNVTGLNGFWSSLIFLCIFPAAVFFLDVPFSLYARFVLEERFGFNTSNLRTWIVDKIKAAAVSLVFLVVLLSGLMAVMSLAGELWWLAAWVFWCILQISLVVLYPVLISPLFNTFEPLPEGSLKDRLCSLAGRENFAHSGIYVMDGSRRSRHSNAYFTGLGKSRRIVLFDTLVEALTEDELEAVLAHEIGHWKHSHIRKQIAFSLPISLLLFAAAGRMLQWEPVFESFVFSGPSLAGLLLILGYFSKPVASLIAPLGHFLSRRWEYQADRFAARSLGTAAPMCSALLALGRSNLSNLTPHRAYSLWYGSHPTLSERLEALESPAEC